jgi:hypothetical protein
MGLQDLLRGFVIGLSDYGFTADDQGTGSTGMVIEEERRQSVRRRRRREVRWIHGFLERLPCVLLFGTLTDPLRIINDRFVLLSVFNVDGSPRVERALSSLNIQLSPPSFSRSNRTHNLPPVFCLPPMNFLLIPQCTNTTPSFFPSSGDAQQSPSRPVSSCILLLLPTKLPPQVSPRPGT